MTSVEEAESLICQLERDGTARDLDLAGAYMQKANALHRVGRTREALSVYDQVVARFGDSNSAEVMDEVGWALHHKALQLRSLGERDAAWAAVKSLRERVPAEHRLRHRAVLLDTRVLEALLLFDEDRFEDGLAQLRAVVKEVPKTPPSPLLAPLAHALTAQAVALTELGQYSDALVVCSETLHRFRSSPDPDIREQVAQVLLARADCLSEVGQDVAAVSGYTELLESFPATESPILRRVLADALLERARSKLNLGEDEAAAADIDRFVADYWQVVRPTRRVRALSHKATAYINQGRLEDALPLLDRVLSCLNAEEHTSTRDVLAHTIYQRGIILERLGKEAEARAAYDEVMRRFGQVEERDVREMVSMAAARLAGLDGEHRLRQGP